MTVIVTSLRLVNFKYHSDLSFKIPEGLVQFGGISGSGKSSAAAGISYALFGKVWKTKSLTRYGEKAFSVRLGLKDSKGRNYVVTRVNTPRSLKLFVDKKLVAKDDEAQERIIALTGLTFHRYAWGCFLRNDSSLLEVTPEKKYEGVCALAGVVSSDIDAKIQEIHASKKSKEKRLGIIDQKIGRSEGSIKSIRTELKKYDDLPDPGGEDDPDLGDDLDETTLTDHQTRLDEIDSILANFGDSERASLEKEKVSLEAKLETIEDDLVNTEGYDNVYIGVARLANEVRRTREELQHVQKSVAAEGQKRKATILEFYEAKLPKNVDVADYRDWVAGLREEWKAYEVQTSVREKALEVQNKAKDQTIKIFREIKKYFPLLAEVKSTKVMLDRLDQLSLRLAPRVWCPCCEVALSIINGELVEAGDFEEDEADFEDEVGEAAIQQIKNFQDQLKKLQPLTTQPIPDEPTKPKRSLTRAEELLEEVEIRQLEIRSIDTGSHPLLTKARAGLKAIEKQFLNLEAKSGIEVDPDDLTDEDLAEHEALVLVRNKALANKKSLRLRLAKVQKILDESDSIETLLEEAADLREQIKTLEAKISARKEAERIAQLYADRDHVLTRLAAEEKSLSKQREIRASIENQIIGLQGLKAKIKEATLLSIEETILGVNREAQTYLEKLFDTPITVALGLSSKTEGKIEVRVIREHNDPKGESKYDDLSDGEKQRVRLAFFLGINTYLDARLKLIVIDEALNQVEESLNSRSIDLVRGISGTKIIISHEAVTGQFEKVVMFQGD